MIKRSQQDQLNKVFYNPKWLQNWKSGKLPKEWHRRYPHTFDSDDLRLALSQTQYHFFEWVAARHFADLGYDVLIEQYVYKTHRLKRKKLESTLGNGSADRILNLARKCGAQPPDLIMVKRQRCWFGEVKSATDRLRPRQQMLINRLLLDFGITTRIIYVLPSES